ncbi:MAG: 16S rRNA (guanine(527)-N(7))-methyltransferase RsmG [Bryobacteraceae bacterium]
MSDEREFSELLTRHFSAIKAFSPLEVSLLYQHYELLVRWNTVLNLTSIRLLEEAVVRHYCESLFVAVHLPAESVSVLDVGSGAGFPGIPMAVLRPDCRFVLAESHRRKAVFLREATRGYANLRVESRRAEDIAGSFDWVVSRAVRWNQVLPVVQTSVALLLGHRDAESVKQTPGFDWLPDVPLPWGDRRFLVMGTKSPL